MTDLAGPPTVAEIRAAEPADAPAIAIFQTRCWRESSVFRDNPRAQSLYRMHGFGVDGTVAVDPDTGVDEVRMTRP